MEIPDLTIFPPGHPPTPYDHPIGYRLPPNVRMIAIGWIEQILPNKGLPSAECVDLLIEAFEEGIFIEDLTMGEHSCMICSSSRYRKLHDYTGHIWHALPNVSWKSKELSVNGHGHFLVRLRDIVYMAPVLIIHYITAHMYRPPDEFVRAVMNGNILGRGDLEFVPRKSLFG